MIELISLLALTLPPLLIAQEDATAPPPAEATEPPQAEAPVERPFGDDEGWSNLNGVALIVNDRIITLSKLDQAFTRALSNAESTLPQDALELQDTVVTDSIMNLLQIQAGQALGVPALEVERTIDGFINDRRREKSAQEMTQWLVQEGVPDLGALRERIREELYRSIWSQSTVGLGGGADQRPYQDRYVRPGLLKESYYLNKGVFAQPSRYILQYLRLLTNAWGDAETALEVAEDLRSQIVAGADMGSFVDEYGSYLRESRGIAPQFTSAEVPEPEVSAFLQDAERGALSMALPFTEKGELMGYDVVRVVEFVEGRDAPPFLESNMQSNLRRSLQDFLDSARITNGSDSLWRTAYIRPPANLKVTPPWIRREAQQNQR
jgi:hypothetical protein